MKRALPIIVIAAVVAAAAVFGASSTKSSADAAAPATPGGEAASDAAGFVRPDFNAAPTLENKISLETLNRKRYGVDLTGASVLGQWSAYEKLSTDVGACYDALDGAEVKYTRVSATRNEEGCGYNEDALQLDAGVVRYTSGEPLVMTCAEAARLHLWERQVVAPAAARILGSELASIDAFGAFSCRRIGGDGRLSEHAYGRAADIKGFTLADGRKITVLGDFHSEGPEGVFLREIRDGACNIFDVTLSPDYNADHANHFHLDVGGERVCH
jgi:hypothetical protein